MRAFPTLDHEQLLTLARKTEWAARHLDQDRIETSALQLFEAVVDHVQAEKPELLRVGPADARLLERGQQRVVDLVVELAAEAAEHRPDCRCDRVATNLVAELTVQARAEHRALVAAR